MATALAARVLGAMAMKVVTVGQAMGEWAPAMEEGMVVEKWEEVLWEAEQEEGEEWEEGWE